jgi:signal peptidase II
VTALDRLRLAAPIAVIVIAFDQLTKWWALEALADGDKISVFPTLELQLARNSGFSFSTGSGNGSIIGLLVLALCGAMVWYIVRATSRVSIVLVAGILGGAIGNLIDRLFRADDGFLSGEVVDFIDVTWYAVFNVADAFVVCGAIAVVIFEWRTGRDQPDPEAEPEI